MKHCYAVTVKDETNPPMVARVFSDKGSAEVFVGAMKEQQMVSFLKGTEYGFEWKIWKTELDGSPLSGFNGTEKVGGD